MRNVFTLQLHDERHEDEASAGTERLVAGALSQVLNRIHHGRYEPGYYQNVLDANGNIIGQWRLKL